MALPIERYALVGDTQTAALVGDDGSIDWMCLPRFDSDACFAALLGTEANGRWLVAPAASVRRRSRRYRPGTAVLETRFECDGGVLEVVDCMPPRERDLDLVRVARCLEGRVRVRMELRPRFGHGADVPWIRATPDGFELVAGPDALRLRTGVPVRAQGGALVAEPTLRAGEHAAFLLTWHPSHAPCPRAIDPLAAIQDTERFWRAWSDRCAYEGPWREAVVRSLVTLKLLTYDPTGGLVAAPTTSLPERIGGVRNWDYRSCWIRDATFTLFALLGAGYQEEARAWRDWLLRAAAGEPGQIQILYGPAGERRLEEMELPWLPGYEGSRPVRIGNAAARQFQLDVYGELMDCLHQARSEGLPPTEEAWAFQRGLLDHLEQIWREPDEGIWEVRSERAHFTHSKVMAWVAFDRAAKGVEARGLDGPVERWRALCREIRDDVCTRGVDPRRGVFTRAYGSRELDASLLLIPLVGFLPPEDERVRATVDAIARDLRDGELVRRYRSHPDADGLPAGEGAFLPCSFWLVDCLALLGRRDEACALFERLLALRNDVGLLSEEYDVERGRMVGNFPQAFSHVALVNSARNLGGGRRPAEDRRGR